MSGRSTNLSYYITITAINISWKMFLVYLICLILLSSIG